MSGDDDIREHHVPPPVGLSGPVARHRADDWADPWMRGGPRNERDRVSPSGSGYFRIIFNSKKLYITLGA